MGATYLNMRSIRELRYLLRKCQQSAKVATTWMRRKDAEGLCVSRKSPLGNDRALNISQNNKNPIRILLFTPIPSNLHVVVFDNVSKLANDAPEILGVRQSKSNDAYLNTNFSTQFVGIADLATNATQPKAGVSSTWRKVFIFDAKHKCTLRTTILNISQFTIPFVSSKHFPICICNSFTNIQISSNVL